MNVEPPLRGAPMYRLTGRSWVEAELLPLGRLITALPWIAATFVILRSFQAWAGLWPTVAVIAVRCVLWILGTLLLMMTPDEEEWQQAAKRNPGSVRYPPDRYEDYARLAAARNDVARAAGIPESWIRLALLRSKTVNGTARPKRIVQVTDTAVRKLEPLELRALVGHELGHHLIGVPSVFRLEILCTQPVASLFNAPTLWVLYLIHRRNELTFLRAILLLLGSAIVCVVFVEAMMPTIGRTAAIVLAAICLLQPLPRMWLSWRGEFLADRVATDLGYGPALAVYLETGDYDPRSSLTHPSISARVRRIHYRVTGRKLGRR